MGYCFALLSPGLQQVFACFSANRCAAAPKLSPDCSLGFESCRCCCFCCDGADISAANNDVIIRWAVTAWYCVGGIGNALLVWRCHVLCTAQHCRPLCYTPWMRAVVSRSLCCVCMCVCASRQWQEETRQCVFVLSMQAWLCEL